MKELFNHYDIEIDNKQIEKFQTYYQLLIEWNQKINLTTITDYQDVIKKHFLDSCLLLRKYNKENFLNSNIIDVGTGAGFPGVPLAILMSDVQFTLIDSLNKRIDFLFLVTKELQLNNIQLIHGRAEDLGKDDAFREQYDYCVSRAVASLPLLLEYCSPFIKVDGTLLLYKSKKLREEIVNAEHALEILNCKIENEIELSKEMDFERYLLKVNKHEHTPEKYPRRAGKPKKNPL